MTLMIDNRLTVPGPGLHALIVGVSEYTHLPEPNPVPDPAVGFGMVRLASPALSAYRLYQWLERAQAEGELRLAAPLKTCRLLIAPSALEKAAEPELERIGVEPPTYHAFSKAARAWRKDASDDKRNISLFFFSGHGVRTHSEDSVLTMLDFGDPELEEMRNCVKTSNLQLGMASTQSRPNMAQTQFYFIDACRNMPEQMKRFAQLDVPPVWTVELNNQSDTRSRPIYFSAAPGALAHGRRGMTSYFCEGLLDGLGRAAESKEDPASPGTERWVVTPSALGNGITRFVRRTFALSETDFFVDLRGVQGDSPLVCLDAPPIVDLDIDVQPTDLAGQARIALLDGSTITAGAGTPAVDLPLNRPKVAMQVRAGPYFLRLRSARLQRDYVSMLKNIDPTLVTWFHRIPFTA